MISFSGRHYPRFIILQCVRWYLSYALSYRNIEEMMAERGFEIWVLHFAPLLEQKSRKYKHLVHRSWRMDETYIKIKGKRRYLYRAVDKCGATIEFMVSKKRDMNAAKAFFRKALKNNRMPYRINIDKSSANKAALEHFNKPVLITDKRNFTISQSKYLNNIVEQDHRHIKRMITPMGCFRKMHTATRTIAGIERMNMIKKKQLNFTKYIDQNHTPAEQFYRLESI